jgi:hypothetical protein
MKPSANDRESAGETAGGSLEHLLEEWREAGLIRADQMQSILRHESAKVPAPSRIPIAAEAVGYVGAALVVAAVALLIGRRWEELAVGLRIAVLLIPAVACAAAGRWLGSMSEAPLLRLASVLWVLSPAALAGALTVVFVDAMFAGDPPSHGGVFFVSGIVVIWAAIEYALRRTVLQHIVLFVSVLATVLGVVDLVVAARGRGLSTIVWGLAVWTTAAAWTALGLTARLEPPAVARLIGPVTMLIGSQVVRTDAEALGLWFGFATAAVLLVLGVEHTDVVVLLVGAIGLFQWSPQLAVFYLADTLGTEVTLLAVGLLLLGAAFVFTRLYQRVRSAAGGR